MGDQAIREGDVITIDGTSGSVFLGEIELIEPEPTPELARLLEWADEYRRLGVRANADTPIDARKAREWGAEGIGLARTEHMFLGNRLPIVRRLILTEGNPLETVAHITRGAVIVFDGQVLPGPEPSPSGL